MGYILLLYHKHYWYKSRPELARQVNLREYWWVYFFLHYYVYL